MKRLFVYTLFAHLNIFRILWTLYFNTRGLNTDQLKVVSRYFFLHFSCTLFAL